MIETDWGAHLDALAGEVFGGPQGSARLQPLLERFSAAVGTFVGEGASAEGWHQLRSDWALCEAGLDHPRDTWLRRMAASEQAHPATVALARHAMVSVFEFCPGRRPWLVDRLRGLEGPMQGELTGLPSQAQLWEARCLVQPAGLLPLRTPVVLDARLEPWLEPRRLRALVDDAPVDLTWLRRGRLRAEQNPRLDLAAAYGDPSVSSGGGRG